MAKRRRNLRGQFLKDLIPKRRIRRRKGGRPRRRRYRRRRRRRRRGRRRRGLGRGNDRERRTSAKLRERISSECVLNKALFLRGMIKKCDNE